MPEDWTDISTPEVRVRTIAESMNDSRTVEWVAQQGEVDVAIAQDVLDDMVDEGILIQDGSRYEVNEYRALADAIRDIGEETEDGILIPWGVIEEYESPN